MTVIHFSFRLISVVSPNIYFAKLLAVVVKIKQEVWIT